MLRSSDRDGPDAFVACVLAAAIFGCGGELRASKGEGEVGEQEEPFFTDVSTTHLPREALNGPSMDAAPSDLDADGNLDVVIAVEHASNILLLNRGDGRFFNVSDRLPRANRDSEDIGIADFDGDGDLDIVVVNEDDRVNELYFNDGKANFTDEGARLPVTGVSNAVQVADLTGDGAPDILIGNNGQNFFLVNDGAGSFANETPSRLPTVADVTQDLELGDVDSDGDLDLVVGNEDRNRLLINDGTGRFTDESEIRIPLRGAPEETREADFGDIDGDGDLDILFANARLFVQDAEPRNRVLINDGWGFFVDETEERLPRDDDRSLDGDFHDVDGDGDVDILTGNFVLESQRDRTDPYHVYLNDGFGRFSEATDAVLGEAIAGIEIVFDVEFGDVDGDGLVDIYLAESGNGDRLFLRVR